jgi:hypothetical protein
LDHIWAIKVHSRKLEQDWLLLIEDPDSCEFSEVNICRRLTARSFGVEQAFRPAAEQKKKSALAAEVPGRVGCGDKVS